MHEAGQTNTVREGGLWYGDKQEELVREARTILNANPLKRKDQVKQFAKIFWIVVGGVALFLLGIVLVS